MCPELYISENHLEETFPLCMKCGNNFINTGENSQIQFLSQEKIVLSESGLMFIILCLPLSASMKPWLIKLHSVGRGAGKSWMTNVRWHLYRIIIIASLRLLDIGIAKWNEDENIFFFFFCECCITADCIITADARLGSQEECRLERTLSFFDQSRQRRQVAKYPLR